ncbi:chromosomal replication initiator protein DnaA [Chloroflexota bacterium]
MGTRSAKEIWEAALGELEIQVSKSNYRTWLEKTVGLSFQDSSFVVSAPNTFIAEYLDKNQRSLIEKTLINVTSYSDIKVTFQVDGKYKNSTDTSSAEWQTLPLAQYSNGLKSAYVFESFITGNGNRLAYAAALGVAQNPGHSYNPLFIYGVPGLGKTHLLHAIGHVAQANNIKVICVSAEQFTNEFVTALRDRKTDEFRNKYRKIGMLLIDDIHFISGKAQTEESFSHTFDELHNAGRQIAITSDQPPKSIPLLGEPLRSRFEWGLVVAIKPPDFETRLAILQAKAKQREVEVNLEVLEFIARQAQKNIRELEGSLNRVIAYAKLFNASPTVELAAQALETLADKESPDASITPDLVIKTVADSFQLATGDLKGNKRDKETSLARRLAMYLLRQETNYSVAQIGQELGGRDPSAVTNACKKITSDVSTNPYLKRKILDIQKRINK